MATEIFVETKNFSQLSKFLQQEVQKQVSLFVLVDQHTQLHCLPLLSEIFGQFVFHTVVIEAGEENKTLSSCEIIWDALNEARADRKSLLINLGGGMITDLGGFCASVYKRGIGFIHIPTTLLGMVDAAIGGKTGVDFKYLKNHIGTFYSPKAIFVYPGFLETLNRRNKISGIAEIIKHALIGDDKFWQEIVASDEDFFYEAATINKAALVKIKIVETDPEENGSRKILNFGHTIGHAFESLSLKYDKDYLMHGEAVAMGMLCESWLSKEYGSLNETDLDKICHVIFRYFKKYNININQVDELLLLMSHDKKNNKGEINFNVLTKIGSATFDNYFSINQIVSALNWYRAL